MEQDPGAARQFDVVLQVAAGFVAVEADELEPQADALGKGLQALAPQMAGRFGVAAEDEGEDRAAVEVEGGEQAEFLEHGRGEIPGLVDDQHRRAAGLGEFGQLMPDAGAHLGGGPGGVGAEGGEDLQVQLAHLPRWVGQGDEAIVGGHLLGAQRAQQGRLARAGFSAETGDLAWSEGVVQALQELLVPPGREQGHGGDILAERGGREPEVLEVPDVQCTRVMRQRGMGIREIARVLHVSRKTVRKYTAPDDVVDGPPR